ncbi:hypothetical protein [Bradyrhizobium guangdongense]|uniref:HEPN AbiU2-like domain-containing protein n=1 Tax=Bradyrhizobium guangdongense TaxID=1325090 RepID=A0A410UZF6_9BRAD|nr:hypothetical protein [Bradyrhizobium guangdongense]QAU36841.1 hypothetical protein X265_03345 [Bradyrhizobium guangdongense]QOZ57893.1 hypothetical protein XH86_03345 [Bradyrhizobium guangdongense]GGI27848.1 hypothetical protein GCM10010987_46440 [Bradyrhizobium guangdongense]
MTEAFKQNGLFRGLQNDLAHLNACVGNNGGPYDLFDYSWGYFEGTRLLLREAQEPGIIIDVVIYPICFNFRHAIELYIKYIIADLGRVNGTGQQYQPGHTLLRNWKKAKKLLSAIDHSADDVAIFEEAIKHIDEVDRSGQTFRYPESIKYDQHLKDWPSINLAVLEYHHGRLFKVARDWHYRIDAAVDRAAQDGTLAQPYRRPPDQNGLLRSWHFFIYRAQTAALRVGSFFRG